MKKHHFLAATLITALLSQANAVELLNKENATFNMGGRFQLYGVGQRVSDPFKQNERAFLFLKQARLMTYGQIEDYKYYAEWAMGGEEAVKNLNSSIGLLDFRADIPVSENFYLRAGQFKTPFGRESLTDDGAQNFTERSINNLTGIIGRDVGVAAVLQQKGLMGTLGIFTGGGRDNPERYLPEELGTPLVVARFGYDSEGNDPYTYKNDNFNARPEGFAGFLNLAYMEDTRIGHSSVLNVKAMDRSLLLNPYWNPYMAQAPYLRSRVFQGSIDLEKSFTVAGVSSRAELETTHSEFSNEYGKLQINGARLAGVASVSNQVELGLRYAAVYPSNDFKYTGKTITGSDPFQEITASLNYFHRKFSRFTFEAVFHLNTPVAIEPGVGSYLLVEQPDQAALVKSPTNGYVERQFVPEGKFMYQLSF
jgi:hypothetical protein